MQNLNELSNFKALRITLASPEEILSWSHGEITKPETINYRTFKPEKDGLFDERIFGPTKDFECYCGKYKRVRYKGVICDKCGVEVTYSRVRRERMGHISLATPVAHVWYFRGIPSQMGILLDLSPRDLESVIYFSSHLVIEIDFDKKAEVLSLIEKQSFDKLKDLKAEFERSEKAVFEKIASEKEKSSRDKAGNSGKLAEEIEAKGKREIAFLREKLTKNQEEVTSFFKSLLSRVKAIGYLSIIPDAEYLDLSVYLDKFARVMMGAEALSHVLKPIDVDEISKGLKKKIVKSSGQRRIRFIKKLKVVEGFKLSRVHPSWMILQNIAVIPPELRPMVQLEGGRFATSDLNDLYRRVINRNNRLSRLLELGAPEIIIRNEKRMLQEAVDSLIDSSKQRGTTRPVRGKQDLRSLSDMLKGKQGRFRRNLLGKRVDYSGRSVIVVGPHLKLNQCGLPKEMVLELFKPFVLREILKAGLAPNLKSARFVLESRIPEVWDILESLVSNHPVFLNRAPTLHRLGIQSFYPILIDGSAIQVHPCVCSGYNADFDGDQMAVHVPLSTNARKEAAELMLSSNNLLLPASGVPVTLPNRDMIVGTYYLTTLEENPGKEPKTYSSHEEVLLSYEFKNILLREPVKLRVGKEEVITSAGRIIFNKTLPESLGFYNSETNKENGAIKKLVEKVFRTDGREKAVAFIDDLKDVGFKYSTLSGFSMGIMDGQVPQEKQSIINEADKKVAEIDTNFRRGLITKREKLRLIENVWSEVTNKLDDLVWSRLSPNNPIKAMVRSGARGTRDQVKQIAGIRGLIVDPLGRLVELPIRSNYVEGLTGFEYFASARGARKGLVDTALKTADAGYLTRRLIDVAQDVIIRTDDCGTLDGIDIVRGEEHLLTSFADRLYGRVLAEDVLDPKSSKKVLVVRGTIIRDEALSTIDSSGVKKVKVRSALTCEAKFGICSLCYGLDLSTRGLAAMGSPAGIIAAQSIGEPGTQLTLRTRHTGGIATSKDVTQGLPRVEELFEARTPKFLGVISEVDGKVRIEEFESKKRIIVEAEKNSGQEDRAYDVDPIAELKVKDGDLVAVGTQLTEGYLDLVSVMRTLGIEDASKYIISEIQKVYSSQGVTLNDKHIEVIVRQMFSKVRIESSGDSRFLPGELVSRFSFQEENEKILAKEGEPALGEVILLGITKSSLETDSFLAAASFMETTRVLTEASISGRVDRLLGLKENVIIGRLIPVGESARVD